MLKNTLFIFVGGLLVVCGVSALTQPQAEEGRKFNRGTTYNECLDNCREHHRGALNWRRGEGRGLCWDECRKSYPRSDRKK